MAAASRRYYLKNRDAILAKSKAKRNANLNDTDKKMFVQCECKQIILKVRMTDHLTTSIHAERMTDDVENNKIYKYCSCGQMVKGNSKCYHVKSRKHRNILRAKDNDLIIDYDTYVNN